MNYKEALEIFFERSNATQTFWNFHLTVILALIAFIATVKVNTSLRLLAVFLTVAFAVFACVNLKALVTVTDQRLALAAVIKAKADADRETSNLINPTIVAPKVWQVCVSHLLGDIFAVVAIWTMVLSKQRKASGDQLIGHPPFPVSKIVQDDTARPE
jgi:hypothetical protein